MWVKYLSFLLPFKCGCWSNRCSYLYGVSIQHDWKCRTHLSIRNRSKDEGSKMFTHTNSGKLRLRDSIEKFSSLQGHWTKINQSHHSKRTIFTEQIELSQSVPRTKASIHSVEFRCNFSLVSSNLIGQVCASAAGNSVWTVTTAFWLRVVLNLRCLLILSPVPCFSLGTIYFCPGGTAKSLRRWVLLLIDWNESHNLALRLMLWHASRNCVKRSLNKYT